MILLFHPDNTMEELNPIFPLTLANYQHYVDGIIEVQTFEHLQFVLNEEGRLLNLPLAHSSIQGLWSHLTKGRGGKLLGPVLLLLPPHHIR
jgi:hypothetical protein